MAGISPLEFDRMALWQAVAAVRGFDERMKLTARIGDALVYKMIRGSGFKPSFVPFDKLFPQWAQPEQESFVEANRQRLDEWCDVIEG